MTAGMVSVPTIVPLKAPGLGRKWEITSRTPIELACNTPESVIFYTVDGSKPDPFKKIGQTSTFKYTQPIYLGIGKITLKALAVLKDGSKESRVNTKAFQISEPSAEDRAEELDDEDDESYVDDDDFDGKEQLKSGLYETKNPYADYSAERQSNPREATSAWGREIGNYTSNERLNDARLSNNKFLHDMGHSGRDGTLRSTAKEYTKSEDSGVRKVLNGIEMQKMSINDQKDVERSYGYDMMNSGSGFPRTAMPPRSGVTARHVLEATDALKCLYCHAVRPSDAYARFCNECGGALPTMPGARTLPPSEGSVGPCPFCHSKVPLNVPNCIICDGIFHGKSVEVSTKYVEKVVCLQCGTSSPSGSKRCVVCENILPVQKVFTQNVVNKPPQPSKDAFLQCSRCSRLNSHDARFCDWCGSKPLPSSSVVTCLICRTSNQPYARYCASCGQTITPPVRPDYASLYPNQRNIPEAKSLMSYPGQEARWHSVPMPLPKADTSTKSYGTQTAGIYFPSSKLIDAQCNDDAKGKTKRPLSAVSPGKGYWRQQIDHVAQHLKVYAQNDVEFRDSISQLKMGKLLGALAQEELDGQELSITLSFGLKNKDKHALNASAKSVQHGIAFINAMKNSKNAKDLKGETSSKKRKIKKKVKKKLPARDSKLSAESLKLLKMLGGTAEVGAEAVNELIDGGADVNAVDSEGMTPLKLAVTSKHIDSLQALIDAGANTDQKSGPKGNTVLHEAVRLGMDGVEATDKLLESGADPDLANDIGQTPYDLALKSGIDGLISRFTAKLGQDLLKETIG